MIIDAKLHLISVFLVKKGAVGVEPLFPRFVERLLMWLRQYVVVLEIEDSVCWKLTNDGVLSIRSMYIALVRGLNVSFP